MRSALLFGMKVKSKLCQSIKNILNDQLWSFTMSLLHLSDVSLFSVFVPQGLTRGRLCLRGVPWSREAMATAACTMRPAATCSSTVDTRHWATISTGWWTTCTATTSTREHGESRDWCLCIVRRRFGVWIDSSAFKPAKMKIALTSTATRTGVSIIVSRAIQPSSKPLILSSIAGSWSQSHHALGHGYGVLWTSCQSVTCWRI